MSAFKSCRPLGVGKTSLSSCGTNTKRRQTKSPLCSGRQADATQAWNFTASNDTFGGDPNYGVPKTFVMIFTIGHLEIQPWAVDTGITVLSQGLALSGLRTISVREGDSVSLLANQIDPAPNIYTSPPPWALQGDPVSNQPANLYNNLHYPRRCDAETDY